RARGLASGGLPAAGRVLGEAAWDVGIPPEGALSPRGAAERVVRLGGLDAEAAQAVHRVAGAVERELYAPPGAEASYPGLSADVLRARTALLASLTRRGRLRALLLPRSAARLAWAASARVAAATALTTRLTTHLPLRRP
ncbi:transglutaminase, partial [Streptomyces sp. NPDC059981]